MIWLLGYFAIGVPVGVMVARSFTSEPGDAVGMAFLFAVGWPAVAVGALAWLVGRLILWGKGNG